MNPDARPFLYRDLNYLGSANDHVGEVQRTLDRELAGSEFSREEIETLCRYMHCYGAPAGTVLLQEGEEGDHLILLLAGQAIVSKNDIRGKPHSLALVGVGNILGEMSLIDGEPRFASCIAVEPVRFAVLTKTALNEILALHCLLANKFLTMLLQMTIGRLRDMGSRAISPLSRPFI